MELRWLPGSTGWVQFGEEPAMVPDTVVNGIQRIVDAINESGGESAFKKIKPGEPVEILDGPFAGYEAVFDRHISGNSRVRILLKLIRAQQKAVEMPASFLRIKK